MCIRVHRVERVQLQYQASHRTSTAAMQAPAPLHPNRYITFNGCRTKKGKDRFSNICSVIIED